jgi:hypothetical protein
MPGINSRSVLSNSISTGNFLLASAAAPTRRMVPVKLRFGCASSAMVALSPARTETI